MLFPCPKCGVGDPARCKRTDCPVMAKYSGKTIKIEGKEQFQGETPNVFVGRYGYPHVRVGLLSTEQYDCHDEPLRWSKENYTIPKILSLRQELVNSTFKTQVRGFNQRFLEIGQEVSMAVKPVDVEIKLNKKPIYKINYQQEAAPHGPAVKLENVQLLENPKIPTQVDSLVGDKDLKATEAVSELHGKGYSEYYLTKLLSVGNLGLKTERKLVPTRWSITAVDDMIGKRLIKEIQDYPDADYQAYYGGYLGNYYLIMLFPGTWSYELIEMSANGNPNPKLWTDYEGVYGRKTYAAETGGGYYANRYPVLERLREMKRKAAVLVLRFITKEYTAPLGVWVCREATRKALAGPAMKFNDREEMLRYVKRVCESYGVNSDILEKSRLLQLLKTQTRLDDF